MGKRVEQTLLKGRPIMANKCGKVLSMGNENHRYHFILGWQNLKKNF